jgi:hypothetical protein
MPAQTYPTEKAVAMYSIIEARLHQTANGDARNTSTASPAAVRVERWRTRPQTATAVAMKQITALTRIAQSTPPPRSMITAAIA